MIEFDEVEFTGEGYKPMVDYQKWRVALLNYIDELTPEKIDNLHIHYETDEVFSLLEGKCVLIFANRVKDKFVDFKFVPMVQGKLYNVKKGQFHSHALSVDGKVIIVENQDTDDTNTEHVSLSPEESEIIVDAFACTPSML